MSRCINVLTGLALVILFPLQAYAQVLSCNGQISGGSLTPGPYFDGTQQATADVIRYDMDIGAADIGGGTQMSIPGFEFSKDCAEDDEYPNCTPPGTNTINYMGNVTTDCVTTLGGATPVNWDDTEVGTQIVFTAIGAPAVVGPGETCRVSFDVEVQNVGTAPDPNFLNQQPVFQVFGFTSAACNNGRQGGAEGTAAYSVAACAIDIQKKVSVTGAGGPFLDADAEPGPDLTVGGDAYFELEVCNTGTAPFVNPPGLEITDDDLLIDTTLPQTLDPNQCVTVGEGQIDSLYQFEYCAQSGAIENVSDAVGTCRVDQADPINDSAFNNAWVNCVAPAIDIIKRVWDPATLTWVDANDPDGPTYPVGGVVQYQLEVCNVGDVAFTNVEISDDDLGILPTPIGPLAVGACTILEQGLGPVTGLDSSIPCSVARQFENIAEADGIYPGGVAEDEDPANVICEPPELRVVKEGPPEAKRGDDITYTVTAYNDSPTVALANCEATDSLTIADPTFPPAPFDLAPGADYQYSYEYTVPAGAPDNLPNTATVECEVVGVSQDPITANSTISASDDWIVPLFVMEGYMVKTCDPDPVHVGEDVCWNITVTNTGDRDFDCTITDTTVPGWNPVDLPGTVTAAGGTQSLVEVCRTVELGEAGSTISNTATAVCTPSNVEYDNVIDVCAHPDADCSADCEVPPEVTPVCRTPGFWGTHAGTEKGERSFNLTQEVIDAAPGGSLGFICGVEITSTDVYDLYGPDYEESALEAICVHPKTKIVRQLMRQMTAAAINCVVSGTTPDCAGLSIGDIWDEANTACDNESGDLSGYIEAFDAFNNGYYPGSECVEDLQESDLWPELYDHKVPGPAGSSDACNYAIQNGWFLVPVNGLDD